MPTKAILEQDLRNANAKLQAMALGHSDLFAYLMSSKFEGDTTVQVADVIRRLREVVDQVNDTDVVSMEKLQNASFSSQYDHAYEVEVKGPERSITVNANNRDQAARFASSWGYEVWSVNMVG